MASSDTDKMDLDASPAPPPAANAAATPEKTTASSVGASADTSAAESLVPKDLPQRTPDELLADFKRRTMDLEQIKNTSDRLDASRDLRKEVEANLNKFGLDGIDQVKEIQKTLDETREMLETMPKQYIESQFRDGLIDERQYRTGMGALNATRPADDVRLFRASLQASAALKHQSQKEYERIRAEAKAKEEEANTLKRKLEDAETSKTTIESELSKYKERVKNIGSSAVGASGDSAGSSGGGKDEPEKKRARTEGEDDVEEEAVGASGGPGGYYPDGELSNPRFLMDIAKRAAREVSGTDMATLLRMSDVVVESRDNFSFSIRPDAFGSMRR